MNLSKLCIAIFSILMSFTVSGQSAYIDSMYQVYLTAPEDEKFFALYEHCYYLAQFDMEKAELRLEKGEQEVQNSDLIDTNKAYTLGIFQEVKAMMAENKRDFAESLRCFQKCFEYSKQTEGNKKYTLQAIAYWGIGMVYAKQGFYQKSNQQFLKAEIAFVDAKNKTSQASCLSMIAENYNLEAKYDSTLIYLNKAISLIDPKKDVIPSAIYTSSKISAFNKLSQPDSAIALVNEDLLNNIKSVNPVLSAQFSFGLADAYSIKEMAPQAKIHLNNGKQILDKTEDAQLYFNYLECNHNYLKAAKDYKGAYLAMEEINERQDSIDQVISNEKFMALQNKFDVQNHEFEITSLKNKNRYQINMMKLGTGLFAIILGTLFFWFKAREAKIKALQSKNNQQIKLVSKYNELDTEIEDEFLKNITAFIQENIDNEDLTVEDLVNHCGMSRNSMNKKIKSLTNKTAVGFIRDIRLEKAHAILQKNSKNVSQVAFAVGFKDPNYFSSCFSEKFGTPPSKILKN